MRATLHGLSRSLLATLALLGALALDASTAAAATLAPGTDLASAIRSTAVPRTSVWRRMACQSGNSQIDPCSGSTSVPPGATGRTVTFRIYNTGSTRFGSQHYFLVKSCSGAVTSCTVSASSIDVPDGSSGLVTITYATSTTAGFGSITLEASDRDGEDVSGTISVSVVVPDATPPTVSISPASGGSYFDPSLAVTITWGDNQSLNATSRTITLNGSAVTGSFGYTGSSTSATSSGTVTLSTGTNTLTAHICDVAGNCTSSSATYTRNPYPPTITITAGTLRGTSQLLTIDWSDDVGLNAASRSITFNGTDVTNTFSYRQDPNDPTLQHWLSDGAVTLQAGSNTLIAHICDVEGACRDATWSYDADLAPPSISFNPSGGVYGTDSITLTVTWCDNGTLNGSSRTLTTVGGVHQQADVTNNFTYSLTGGGCATSSGSIGLYTDTTTTLTAHICDIAGNCADDSADFLLQVVEAVSVTSANASVEVRPFADTVQRFAVQNTGNAPTTFTLAATCVLWATDCRLSDSSLTLDAHQSDSVDVLYRAGREGTTGAVQLAATVPNASITDTRLVTVSVPYFMHAGPKGDTITVGASHEATQRFILYNPASASISYTVSASCTWGRNTISCSPSKNGTTISSVTIDGGHTEWVDVSYQAGTVGTMGRIQLAVTQASDALLADTAWAVPTAASLSAAPPMVSVSSSMIGPRWRRDLFCPTIAAGENAASECSDLRLVHALPTVRTLNTARTPMLLYNSQFASPYTLVTAAVTQGSTTLTPDSVKVRLRVSGVVRDSAVWSGADWHPGAERLVALGLTHDSTEFARYTVEVTNIYNAEGAQAPATANGQIVVVSRRKSPFGPGWWLAGLEQLSFPATDTLLWVGGDGSNNIYTRVASTQVWRAVSGERPDSVVKQDTLYVRYLKHGLRVLFDLSGHHVLTINRLSDTTRFSYRGDTLVTIHVPHWPDTAGTYHFHYTAGWLDSVTVHPAGMPPRVLAIAHDAQGRLTQITGPDTTHLDFGYVTTGDGNRIAWRRDRRGNTTYYAYDAAGKLTLDSLPMGSGQAPIVTHFRPGESRPVAAVAEMAIPRDSLITIVDGPRTDLSDHTQFWLSPLGVTKVVDALSDTTMVDRDDSTWFWLVSRVQYPNGRALTAAFDGHGNIVTTTDLSRYDPVRGIHATTRYVFDQKWDFDSITVPPEGDSTVMAYDPQTGNRLWQQDARGDSTRTCFDYNAAGQLKSISARGCAAPPTIVAYDPVFGNMSSVTTPLGFSTTYFTDSIGRDTLVISPVDSAQTLFSRHRTLYDAMDRDTIVETISPAISYVDQNTLVSIPAETLFVRNMYDAEGNIVQLSRWSKPDTNAIGTVTTLWQYDPANRRTVETSADSTREITTYDLAGNAIAVRTKRGYVLPMVYDALNRTVQRIVPAVFYQDTMVTPDADAPDSWSYPLFHYYGAAGLTIPADTTTFAYDAVGDMLIANNGDAHISRTYNLDGTLATDTLKIRTYAPATSADAFTKHVYVLGYGYDLDGRRTTLEHPSNLAPRVGGQARTTVNYAYTPAGQLATVTDVLDNVFAYDYDAEGRLITFTSPGQVVEKRYYDDDDRMWHRTEEALRFVGTDSGFTAGLFRDDTLSYDAGDRLVAAHTITDTVRNAYSGIGHVVWSYSQNRSLKTRFRDEQFTPDALGNQYQTKLDGLDPRTNQPVKDSTTMLYDERGMGRLLRSVGPLSIDSTVYDSAGNRRLLLGHYFTGPGNIQERTLFYYGADDKLRVVDKRTCQFEQIGTEFGCNRQDEPGYTNRGVFEEYRYDALGRRILVRSQADSSCVNLCARDRAHGLGWGPSALRDPDAGEGWYIERPPRARHDTDRYRHDPFLRARRVHGRSRHRPPSRCHPDGLWRWLRGSDRLGTALELAGDG